MCNVRRRVALQGAQDIGPADALVGPDVRVHAMTLQGHVLIQLPPGADGRDLANRCGLSIPDRPNTAIGDAKTTMWLGPRAWVVITQAADIAAALAAEWAGALRAIGGHAVELTDAHQSLRISGSASETLLAQGCMLDLDPASFSIGAATRTAIARMPVILHRRDAQSYLLHIDRSIAHQLWTWMTLAVREIAALAAFEPQREAS